MITKNSLFLSVFSPAKHSHNNDTKYFMSKNRLFYTSYYTLLLTFFSFFNNFLRSLRVYELFTM